LLLLSSSATCRVELYGNASIQAGDLARPLDTPPVSPQNIITDVVLDTVPYQWSWQNRIGANADNPQTSLVYITVTNLNVSSSAITITVSYVPLES